MKVSNGVRLWACLLPALLLGCASMFMKGGSLASAQFVPKQVVVSYRAEGSVPAGAEYQLVQTEKGEAILERGPNGGGVLFETKWSDEKGDHFAGWIATSHAYEFLVPQDRRQPARRYVYPAGYYIIVPIHGVERPFPTVELDPVSTLVPLDASRQARK